MEGKLAKTALATVAAALLTGVALAAPASAAAAAAARGQLTVASSGYEIYVTGIAGSLDGAHAAADYKVPQGCSPEGIVASGTTGDGEIWVTVRAICSQ
ncbi:hypothetical protein ACFYNO_08840 [Kitasatospora sp. NPDC006697]|uniref:hypothetical protein n=1 Tax=Kitasatospora sp. NPDC006697 TaxID=3364020 RepID=UPI0036C0A114